MDTRRLDISGSVLLRNGETADFDGIEIRIVHRPGITRSDFGSLTTAVEAHFLDQNGETICHRTIVWQSGRLRAAMSSRLSPDDRTEPLVVEAVAAKATEDPWFRDLPIGTTLADRAREAAAGQAAPTTTPVTRAPKALV